MVTSAHPSAQEAGILIHHFMSSAESSEPQFTPMRTGFWFSTATSIMVRKLSSFLRPTLTLPGLMRYLASARAQSGYFFRKNVPVVVEVADDRDVDCPAYRVAQQ